MADTKTKIILTASDQTRAAFDSVGRNLDSMAGSLFNINGLMASVSAVSLAVLVKSSIDAADEMSKAAQKVGITTEALSHLKYAAELSDVPFESLEKSMTRLSRAAYDATTTNSTAALAFTQMGVAVKDADGKLKDSDALLSEIAAKFAVMEDGSAKTALAMSVFGKSGADLIPLLNSGSRGLKEMADEADALGVTVSTKAGLEAEKFNDSLTKLTRSAGSLGRELTYDLLGPLTQIASTMAEAAKDSGILHAAWIGLGGLGTAIFTDDLLDRSAQIDNRLKSINSEIILAEGMRGIATPISIPLRIERGNLETELAEINRKAKESVAPILPARKGAPPVIENEADKRKAAAVAAAAEKANQALVDRYIKWDEAEFARQEKQTFDLVNKQQERFVALREVAENAEASDLERAQLKLERQLTDLELERQTMATDHELTLAELAAFEQAKADIINAADAEKLSANNKFHMTLQNFAKLNKLAQLRVLNEGMLGEMAIAGTKYRAFFELNKIASTANAVIKGWDAVQSSYAFGAAWGGPVAGAAMAAISAAATAANIAAIQGASFGGGIGAYGAGGGSGGGPIVMPSPLAPEPQQTAQRAQGIIVNVNLGDDTDMPGANYVRKFIGLLNEQIQDGVTIDQIRVS